MSSCLRSMEPKTSEMVVVVVVVVVVVAVVVVAVVVVVVGGGTKKHQKTFLPSQNCHASHGRFSVFVVGSTPHPLVSRILKGVVFKGRG